MVGDLYISDSGSMFEVFSMCMYLVRSCASILGPTDVRPAVHQVNVRLLKIVKDFYLYFQEFEFELLNFVLMQEKYKPQSMVEEKGVAYGVRDCLVDKKINIWKHLGSINHLEVNTIKTGKSG